MKLNMFRIKEPIKKETVEYISEMLENAKWDRTIELDGGFERKASYDVLNDEIIINPEKINQMAKENGFDQDMHLIAVIAHELYHATDKEIKKYNKEQINFMEALYEDKRDFEKIRGVYEKVKENQWKCELDTNKAIEFLPRSHPKFEKLKETFIEMNRISNQSYIDRGIVDYVGHFMERVEEERKKGIPLKENQQYKDMKKINERYEEKENHFDIKNFQEQKKERIDFHLKKGTLIDHMSSLDKQKTFNHEKELKIRIVKEEMVLSKESDISKEKTYFSRVYVLAKEKIKQTITTFVDEKVVSFFEKTNKQMKEIKEKQTNKQTEKEHRFD